MAIYKQWEGWTYEYFDLDVEASTFPGAENFVELWKNKRGSRRMPKWSDYDWYDLTPWWGYLVVVDYSYDPFDFRYRLFGTKVVERFEIDVTGKKAFELQQGRYDLSQDMDFYEKIARELYISRSSGPIHWQNRDYVDVTFVELPMSDTAEITTQSLALMI